MPPTLRAIRAVPSIALVVAVLLPAIARAGQSQRPEPGPETPPPAAAQPSEPSRTLKDLSLEELMQVDVSIASRRSEVLLGTPAAVFVITGEDLRRSGAPNLPEALRLAVGLSVARFNTSTWVINARGFNTTAANKMLVMIDGRTVYSPFFSGVFWDVQDVVLEDVDRIEIIRGPGAAVWGANAVNGVINVITRRAVDTQGTIATVSAGNEERGSIMVRHGGAVRGGHYRVYGKANARDDAVLPTGAPAGDAFRFGQAGFRLELGTPRRGLTLQGDAYVGAADFPDRDDSDIGGGNVLARWTRWFSPTADLRAQVYYDRVHRRVPLQFEYTRGTWDADLRYRIRPARAHELVMGANYRHTRDDTTSTPVLFFVPEDRDAWLASVFVQDDVRLRRGLYVTLGTKIEHNTYAGLEFQPSARVRWQPDRAQTLWAAVSRAVRMPTRFDSDLRVRANETVMIAGTGGFESETVVAWEAGYRRLLTRQASLDVAAFYNRYGDLRSQEPSATIVPLLVGNGLLAASWGFEVAGWFEPRPWLRSVAGYTYFRSDFSREPWSRDPSGGRFEGNDARHQLRGRVSLNLPHDLELDLYGRYFSERPDPFTGDYAEADVRCGWRFREGWDLSIIGRDLLHDRHVEFVAPTSSRVTAFERQVRVRLSVGF